MNRARPKAIMKYFLIAGEPSGDAIGGKLVTSLKKQDPDAEIVGIGGPLMKQAGLKCLFKMEDLNVMGIWEVVMRLPQLKKIMDGVVAEIEEFEPDALVTIDFPDFNFKVAEKIRRRGKTNAKLVHYVAPSVWAWRPGRAKKVASFLDAMMCILPFEPDYFKAHKLRAVYVGNPVLEDHPENASGKRFREEQNIPEDMKMIGVCFGSRPSEIEGLSTVILETVEYLHERYPDLQIVCPTLPQLEYDILTKVHDVKATKYVLHNAQKKWDAIAACDFSITVSGTMALELALANAPHIVVYKTHPLTYMIGKMLVKAKYMHLANIMLDEMVVPEYLQGACKSEPLALDIIKHLEEPDQIRQQREKFDVLRNLMETDKAEEPSDRAARYIQYILRGGDKKKAA